MIVFRIRETKRGFIKLYEAQVKKWYGWRSFWASDDGNISFAHRMRTNCKKRCFQRIENYRRSKGLSLNEIEIINSIG